MQAASRPRQPQATRHRPARHTQVPAPRRPRRTPALNPAGGAPAGPVVCHDAPMTVVEFWRRGQAGWARQFPVVQAPNPPLLLAFAGRAVAARTTGTPHTVGRWVATAGLAVWGWQETTDGVNWFRRLLGAGTLARLAAGLARDLKDR